jgi:hypothetical protein
MFLVDDTSFEQFFHQEVDHQDNERCEVEQYLRIDIFLQVRATVLVPTLFVGTVLVAIAVSVGGIFVN